MTIVSLKFSVLSLIKQWELVQGMNVIVLIACWLLHAAPREIQCQCFVLEKGSFLNDDVHSACLLSLYLGKLLTASFNITVL